MQRQPLRGRSGPPTRPAGSPGPSEGYPLPLDARDLAVAYGPTCVNYGLRLDRFPRCEAQTWDLEPARKREGIATFTAAEIASVLQAFRRRWEAMLTERRQRGEAVEQFRLRAASRVVVGLGAESVLETSLRLHRVYGFPLIPGSALKGLARSVALWRLAVEFGVPVLSPAEVAARERADRLSVTPLQRLEAYVSEPESERRRQRFGELRQDPALSSSRLRQLDFQEAEERVQPLRLVFGTTGAAGRVVFFDAIPADPHRLRLDREVMNPHYSEYYTGRSAPADYLSPIPVYFLTIAPGSLFLFAVAAPEATLAQQARGWLETGLREWGIGAKTAAGYGLWEG